MIKFLHKKTDTLVRIISPLQENDPLCQSSKTVDKHSQNNIQLSLEEFEKRVLPLMHPSTKLSDPQWITSFVVNERVASHYRKDNAFICGDAAHVHSPMGGQGMNLGLQDSFNLAWKMAMVLKGVGNREPLLQSYEQERRPIAKHIVSATSKMTNTLSTLQKPFTQFFVDHVVPYLTPVIQSLIPQKKIAEIGGQIAFHYEEKSPLLFNLVSPSSKPAIGSRAPNEIVLTSAVHEKKSLLDLETSSIHHFLFFFMDEGASLSDAESLSLAIQKEFKEEIDVHIVWSKIPAEAGKSAIKNHWVEEGNILKNNFPKVQKKESFSYGLIRPDGYVSLAGTSEDTDLLFLFLRSFLKTK